MGKLTWISSTGDWQAGASWDTGAAPVDGDEVYFVSGSQSVTTNLGNSSIELLSFNVGPNYTGSIATSGTKLEIDATTLRIDSRGARVFVDGIFTDVICSSKGAELTGIEVDGTITNLWVVGHVGGCIVPSGAALTNFYMYESPQAVATIGTSVTSWTLCNMNSGQLTSDSALTTGNIQGGLWTHTTGAITTLNFRNRARFIHKASGTITTVFGEGPDAKFDGRENTNKTVTITNCTLMSGSELLQQNGLDNYTFTNDVKLFGGRIDFAVGRAINK